MTEVKTVLQVACLGALLIVLIIAGVTLYRFNIVLEDFRKSFIFQTASSVGYSSLESLVSNNVKEEIQDISPLEEGSQLVDAIQDNMGLDDLEIPGIGDSEEEQEPEEYEPVEESEDIPDESEATPQVIEVDTGNICGRTPEIQQRLIEMLQITSCREITGEELVRVRKLELGRMPLTVGDLDGFINLKSLSLSAEDAPAGLFDDLVSLEKLELGLKAPPSPGLFKNLGKLKEVKLSIDDLDDSQNYDTQYNAKDLDLQGVFEGLTALKHLVLEVSSDSYAVALKSGSLTGMPILQELKIYNIGRVEAGSLNDLPALRSAHLQPESLPDYLPKPHLPVDIFARNPDLVYLQLNGWGEISRLEFNSLDVVCRIEGDVIPYHYYDRDFTAVVDQKLVKRSGRDGNSDDEWECKLRLAPIDTDNWDIENWEEVLLTVPPLPESRRS